MELLRFILLKNKKATYLSSSLIMTMTAIIIKNFFKSIVLVLAFHSVVALQNANAQFSRITNMPEHDTKWYYFGITFGFNYSNFRTHYTDYFANNDSFRLIQPKNGPGFSLGIMGNLRANKFVDLRFIPSLTFANKGLLVVPNDLDTVNRQIESIFMSLPLQLKFKSDRIGNFRFYGIIGSKFDYDLAANAKSRRQDEFLRIKPLDLGAEVGFGLEFYYPNFIFSPEIKISQGFTNMHFYDSQIKLSNAIEKMNSRMIMLSIHIEG